MDLAKAIQTLAPMADAILSFQASMKQITNVERDYIAAAKRLEGLRVDHNELTTKHSQMFKDLAEAKAQYEEIKRKAAEMLRDAGDRAENMILNAQQQAKFKADAEYQTHVDDIERVAALSQAKQKELNDLHAKVAAVHAEHSTLLNALSNLKSKIGAV